LHENNEHHDVRDVLEPNYSGDRLMVETRSLTRDFGQMRAVDNVNIQVKAGSNSKFKK
jgi:ABC-2 type transport system ATP-binding protein